MKRLLVAVLLLVYAASFWHQELVGERRDVQLSPPFRWELQRAALGYLRQLGAEMHFVRTAVFLGGRPTGFDLREVAPAMSQIFSVSSKLYPQFVDTYFLCESSLANLGEEYARIANRILDVGIEAIPGNWVLPFFAGFNCMHYLNQTTEASRYLHEAGQRPDAPRWIAHLSALLAAKSGQIYAGLLWLKAMEATEENEVVRAHYRKEIGEFEKALKVLHALGEYKREYGRYPERLSSLVPGFLDRLPEFDAGYELVWNPPDLHLVRARRR